MKLSLLFCLSIVVILLSTIVNVDTVSAAILCSNTVGEWAYAFYVDETIVLSYDRLPSTRSNVIAFNNIGTNDFPELPACNYEGQVYLALSVLEQQSSTANSCPAADWYPWNNIEFITSAGNKINGIPSTTSVRQEIPDYIIEWDGSEVDCLCPENYSTGSQNPRGYWNIGGDIPSTCCGDDYGEYRTIEIGESDAPVFFDDRTDGCCDKDTDCVENSECYPEGYVYPYIANGLNTYAICNNTVWYGGDNGIAHCEGNDCVWFEDNSWDSVVEPGYCCGDDDHTPESFDTAMDGDVIAMRDGTLDLARTTVYGCCDEATDCVYRFECYNKGDIITPNPRYRCGDNTNLIEAVDFDYMIESNPFYRNTLPESRVFVTQDSPGTGFDTNNYDSVIVCNADETVAATLNLPQIWTNVTDCEQGDLYIRLLNPLTDAPILGEDVKISLELPSRGIGGIPEFEDAHNYRTEPNPGIESVTHSNPTKSGDYYALKNVLGSYFTVLVTTTGGYVGVETPVRVDYNGDTYLDVYMYKGTGCVGCVDYAVGGGLCSADCANQGLTSDLSCEFPNAPDTAVMDACDKYLPGTRVSVGGNIYACCGATDPNKWFVGYAIPRTEAEIECDGGNLVTKEYILSWDNKPITARVSVCE